MGEAAPRRRESLPEGWERRERFTFFPAAVVGLPVGVVDVLEGEEKQHHLPLLVLDGHDVQQAPEGRACRRDRPERPAG